MEFINTGIEGLDKILMGGFVKGHQYLLVGPPGSGKTILGAVFCMEGVKNNEKSIYITVEEPPLNIRNNLRNLNIELEGVEFLDATPKETSNIWSIRREMAEEDILFGEIYLNLEHLKSVIKEIAKKEKISRIVVDSISTLTSFYDSEYKARRAIIDLVNFFKSLGCTALFIAEEKSYATMLEYLVDGVLKLAKKDTQIQLKIEKVRGQRFMLGTHTVSIVEGKGIFIYPNYAVYEHVTVPKIEVSSEVAKFGVKEIDSALGGGLERGTLTLLAGNTGTGKTLLSLQFLINGVKNKEEGLLIFLEGTKSKLATLLEGFNIDIKKLESEGLRIHEVDPYNLDLNKLTATIVDFLCNTNIKRFVLDGLRNLEIKYSMAEINEFTHMLNGMVHLNKLTGIVTREIPEVTGQLKFTEAGISYNFDNLILMRYSELAEKITKTFAVIKVARRQFSDKVYKYKITNKGFEFIE